MSIVHAMPSYQHPFDREYSSRVPHTEPLTRPRQEPERISLPSIRQTLPEFLQRDSLASTPPSAISPTGAQFTGTITPPEYVVSPNRYKRRRSSFSEDEGLEWDVRESRVPRPYATNRQVRSRPQSPRTRPWADSDRPSPYINNAAFPAMRSPVSITIQERAETRPTLPSLPMLNFERGVSEAHRIQGHAGEDYVAQASRRSSLVSANDHGITAGSHGFRPGYGYHHPNRAQSLSLGSAHLDGSSPFSPGAYGPPFQDSFMRIGDYNMGANGDGKQRKRRGNLPKETTDKLRSWFVGHLHHPYPTEDEKQELMRQTGLQMNQISNWFINARRRQLPAMINNARVESDARNGRAVDGNGLPSSERRDYENEGKHQSDSEGSNYEDIKTESPKRHRTTNLKRGSV
jgi:hypothetical protein